MDLTTWHHKKLHQLANHPKAKAFVQRMLPYRLWVIVPLHILLFTLSYFMGYFLLYGPSFDRLFFESLPFTLAPLIAIRLVVFFRYDLFQGHWRYVSFEDLTNIIRATLISSLIFYTLGILWSRTGMPERLYFIEMVFCIFLVGGTRYIVRHLRENFIQMRPADNLKRILLAGPLKHVQPLIKDLLGDPAGHYLPVAAVDPERPDNYGTSRLSDVPVFPPKGLLNRKKLLRNVSSVVICWPEASRRQISELVDALEPIQAPFKIVPQIEDILSDRVSISDIREVGIEDLLERPPVQIDMDKIRDYLTHKVVMVTGGAGSIGSELCRQIAGFEPKLLVIVERSENSLYDFRLELDRDFPGLNYRASVSSINDGSGLIRIMKKYRVEVVFHAAAYKHVPLMEDAPVESAYNNIIGTYNAACASSAAGVKRFVMISTDKAVNPTNVMGVTKRIAEMVVQSLDGSGKTQFLTVRFGNVLDSAGSVIPIFRKQIKNGGPLTVTHPEIERYFMTIPEATQLVLQAGCMGSGGEIFVLDMGRPVKIVKLAEKLITLSGKRPYEDIDIEFTGLRPGEKMYEELFNTGEALVETVHPRIKTARSQALERSFVASEINIVRELVHRHDAGALLDKFCELVPTYVCKLNRENGGESAAGHREDQVAKRRGIVKGSVNGRPVVLAKG
jgi:FlaA1/EpsC-like NDP-sugar epimerase